MEKRFLRVGWLDRSLWQHVAPWQSYITLIKKLLPVLSLLFLCLTLSWPVMRSFFRPQEKGTIEEAQLQKKENRVLHPIFKSVDTKGQPFQVRAQYAERINDKITHLFYISGDMHLHDGTRLTFSGEKGTYNIENNTLELQSHVQINVDKGYEVKTSQAFLNIAVHTGYGNKPVYGTGPMGETIQAEGFKISTFTKKIEFLGQTAIEFTRKPSR